jgi:hypothetical protein
MNDEGRAIYCVRMDGHRKFTHCQLQIVASSCGLSRNLTAPESALYVWQVLIPNAQLYRRGIEYSVLFLRKTIYTQVES